VTIKTELGQISGRFAAKESLRVWLCDLTYTQQTIASDTMPMAIGCLAAYAEKVLPWLPPVRLFKYPEDLCSALDAGERPDVIGFSNYVWNSRLGFEFAKLIRRHSPETVIVFGGPNYPVVASEQEDFLRSHDVLDFYLIKEAETTLARLIDALVEENGDLEAVKRRNLPSVHALLNDGTCVLSNEVERIRDLTEIPSPYLQGRLDRFFDGSLMPLIQTNRGCPFSCTFCVEGVGYYNKINRYSEDKVGKELDYIGQKMASVRKEGGRNDLFIADSNFGMYKEDIEACHQLARTQELYGWPEYINVATGKNQKERVLEASRIINGALRLSGSVQSLDTTVLENIKRKNISADGLMDLALSAAEIGANSYSEIILGLPGDSRESHFRTVKTVIEAGFTNLFLFQLMLLPGSEMSTNESVDRFGMQTRYRVLPRCYGRYPVLGEEVVAAEIEQICVASNTLSFEDYLSCRFMHLIVTIFYNDGLFGTLLKFLKMQGLSPWRWVEILLENEVGTDLRNVFDSFLDATRNELWDSSEELWNFVRGPGVVERFIDGELGNNLLFVHKTLAITNCVDDLADLARRATSQLLAESDVDTEANLSFVADAATYHRDRMTGVFSNRDATVRDQFNYDIKSFENDSDPQGIEDYAFAAPREVDFVLSDDQRNLIERFLKTFGDSPVGIGRILSRVYVRKLFRQANMLGVAADEQAARLTEKTVQITGLQN
jgi:radical SAM superfamily enzyme YgiQ (UPF0313 family)